jgi:hypothetical protein
MITSSGPDELDAPTSLLVCNGVPRSSRFRLRGADRKMTPISFTYCAMSNAMRVDEPPGEALPAWKIATGAAVFSEQPSAATAAAFLQTVRDVNCIGVNLGIALPWPLDALVRSVGDKTACDDRISELLAGRHGDQAIWERSEESWTANGIAEPDIRIASDFSDAPLDIISQKAPPLIGRRFERGMGGGESDLLALAKRHPNSAWARSTLLFYVSQQKSSADRRLISFLLEADPPTVVSSPTMLSHHAAALIRVIPRVVEKEPLVARLREIMQVGGLSIFTRAADLDTFIELISQDSGFRALIPLIADIYLGPSG